MAEPWLICFFACNREMQPFSFCLVGYSLCVWGGISGWVRALNLTVPLGSGRAGSDNLGYGPGSGFSFEPVQTSILCILFLFALYSFIGSTVLLRCYPFAGLCVPCALFILKIHSTFTLSLLPYPCLPKTWLKSRPTRMTAAEDALCGLRQGGLKAVWGWRETWRSFSSSLTGWSWHDAALGVCFHLGLDDETIRCNLPIGDLFINLVYF